MNKAGSLPSTGVMLSLDLISSGTLNPSDSRYGLRRFRCLIRFSRWPPHRRNGSPALHGLSSTACHPCYPGSRCALLPLFQRSSNGLPLQTTGSAPPFSVTRLRLGSLALRPAALPLGNLRPPITRTPLPSAKKAYGQLLSRDFNPLDIPPITANNRAPCLLAVYSGHQQLTMKEP